MLRRTPRLIHPVFIVLEILDRDSTFYDTSAREPVRQAVRKGSQPHTGTRVKIRCQISFYFAGGRLDYISYDRRGIKEGTDGYVAFRIKDLINKGLAERDEDGIVSFSFGRGDRIVQLGNRVVDLYLTSFEDFAFYPGSSQTMLQVSFQDRAPSAQRGNL